MKSVFARALAAAAALSASAAPLYAQGWSWWNWWGGSSGGSTGGPRPTSVPEIDASAGLLAIAAVIAVMAFVWERRRRAA